MSNKDLTLKQQLFVEAYLGVAMGNGVEAARRAGYKGSDNVLAVRASELVRNSKIAARVRARVEQAGMGADEVLGELVAVGRLPVAEVKEEPKLLAGKVRALEILAKYHGLLKEAAQHPRAAARDTLADLRARFPDLDEATARRIVSETFTVQESELLN